MEAQVTNVAKLAFYLLCQTRQLALFLTSADLAIVIIVMHAIVTSRMGFCNLLYAGLPLGLSQKLQLVQNVAV